LTRILDVERHVSKKLRIQSDTAGENTKMTWTAYERFDTVRFTFTYTFYNPGNAVCNCMHTTVIIEFLLD